MFKYKGMSLQNPRLRKRLRRVPLTFTRASVAYDKYGNSVPVDTPRFGIAGGPNDGVLIEEAHTNLLTADVSQALTTESPYTTGTLDGTYTFSCMTGSYELSGGATGTVTPTSPQTKTITSATVTLTGTATFNQCTKTGYPLSWTLGGTTMAAETLTAPSSVLNIDEDGYSNLLTSDGADFEGGTGSWISFTGSTKTISTEQAHHGTYSLKSICSGANTGEGLQSAPITSLSGKTYNISGWIYAPMASTLYANISGGSGTIDITGTGDWQYFNFNAVASTTAIYINIRTKTTAQAIDFYIDELQVSATNEAKPRIPGGTQVNEGAGTIELEAYANTVIKTDGINNYLLSTADGSGNNQISVLDDSSNNLTITTKASDAATSVSYADSNLTSNNMFKVAAPYKSDKLKLFKDGSSVGTPLTSANLPTTKQTIYLGSKYDGTLQANTLIRNVVLTKQDRVDGEITNRSYRDGFGVDKEVTLIAPLKNNLNAYRVATV